MRSYSRFSPVSLPHQVGFNKDAEIRISDGAPGFLIYGPFFPIDAGVYYAGFYIRLVEAPSAATVTMDVVADGGSVLASRNIAADELLRTVHGLLELKFEAPVDYPRLEVRLRVDAGAIVEVRDLVVFNARPKEWSGR